MTIRQAVSADLADIVEILMDVSTWLGSLGLDQWQYPENEWRARATESIRRGACYVAIVEGTVAATMTLDEYADAEFWQAEDGLEDALYAHRLAVRRSHSGQELGARMVAWASDRAYQAGKGWLRLDAWRSNPGLRAYYSTHGWEYVRTVELGHRKSGTLFQRPTHPLNEVAGDISL
jgi:GNAT superfamily N-acetyltransferase